MDPLLPADCTARFTVQRELARGGFGAVYLATQIALQRPAALKLLDVKGAPEEIQRFLDEARVTASLAHPNIVIVLDFGYDGTIPWIAYEYLDGGTLRARLERGPLPAREAAAIVAQVCEALQAAHERGVLHRDVKPDNVFILPGNRAKIADFGIAKLTQEGAVHTKTGVILGTPAYVAPEQVQGEPASPLSDVYAAGMMLYELVTGDLPFGQGSIVQMLSSRVERDPERPRTRVPDLSPGLDAAIMRALARKPADRWPSARAFSEALAPFSDAADAVEAGDLAAPPASFAGSRGAPSGALRTAAQSMAGVRVSKPSGAVATRRVMAPAPAGPVRSNPGWLAACLFVLGGAVALAAWTVRQSYLAPLSPPTRAPIASPVPDAPIPKSAHAVRVAQLLAVEQGARAHIHVHPAAALTVTLEEDGRPPPDQPRRLKKAPDTIVDFRGLRAATTYRLNVRVDGEQATASFRFETREPGFDRWYQEDLRGVRDLTGFLPEAPLVKLGTSIDRMGDYLAAERMAADTPPDLLISDPAIRHLSWLAHQTRSLAILTTMIQKLPSQDPNGVAVHVVEVARRLGQPEMARKLLPPAPPKLEPDELDAYVVNLGLLNRGRAFETILECGRREPPPAPAAMGRGLQAADGDRARKLFAQWLTIGSPATPRMRSWALQGLKHDHGQAAIDLLDRVLAEGDSVDRGLAAHALVESGALGAAQKLVSAAIRRPDHPGVLWDATRAAVGSEGIETGGLAIVLGRVMKGSDTPAVRAAAAGCAALLPQPELTAPLERLLDDPSPLVASSAAWALARRGACNDFGALRRLAADPRDHYGAAAWALARLNDTEATATLERAVASLPQGQLSSALKMRALVLSLSLWRSNLPVAEDLLRRVSKQDRTLAANLRVYQQPDSEHDPRVPQTARATWIFPFVGYDVIPVPDRGLPCYVISHALWPREADVADKQRPFPTRVSIYEPEGWYQPPQRVDQKRFAGDIWVSSANVGAGEPLGETDTDRLTGLQIVRFWQR